MPAPGEPDFRYYNCNLQAPYMKCKKITMDSFTVNEWQPSGICTYNGFKPMNTVHTFTATDLMCMANDTMSGELTMYACNPSIASSVVLAIITKTRNAFVYANFYQALGNLTSLTVTTSGSSTVTFTFSPAVEIRWIFRGF
jgi:hypothetical protein